MTNWMRIRSPLRLVPENDSVVPETPYLTDFAQNVGGTCTESIYWTAEREKWYLEMLKIRCPSVLLLLSRLGFLLRRLSWNCQLKMLDGDQKSDIVGTAVREVEETGLRLNLKDVIDLTALLDPSTGNRVFLLLV